MEKIIVSLEYTMGDKISDKDVCVNDIVAMERQDDRTVTVKFINGYSIYVSPKIGMELAQLWYKTASDHLTISDQETKKPEDKKPEDKKD